MPLVMWHCPCVIALLLVDQYDVQQFLSHLQNEVEKRMAEKLCRKELQSSGLGIRWADICAMTSTMTDQEVAPMVRLGNILVVIRAMKKVGCTFRSLLLQYSFLVQGEQN